MAKSIKISVRSPDLNLPLQTLTLPPNLTLNHLKSTLPIPETLALDSLFFTASGRPLPDFAPLSGGAALTLQVRLRGGGGDGGSTCAESRDCYLNMYASKKPDLPDPNETRLSKWTTCALSSEPLAAPVVVDRLGNLFNKESLVEALIHKRLPKEFKHIRGLKDMIPVELSSIPDSENLEARFQCPVTGLEFNGKYGFVAIRGCGHMVSLKAMKEVKSSGCLVCHQEFSESDRIVINGSVEEVAVLRARMEEERGKPKEKKEKKVGVVSLSGSKHGIEGKVEGLENGKKDGGGKRFKAVDNAPANATKEVYASIFTSSKKTDFKETYSCRSLPLGRN